MVRISCRDRLLDICFYLYMPRHGVRAQNFGESPPSRRTHLTKMPWDNREAQPSAAERRRAHDEPRQVHRFISCTAQHENIPEKHDNAPRHFVAATDPSLSIGTFSAYFLCVGIVKYTVHFIRRTRISCAVPQGNEGGTCRSTRRVGSSSPPGRGRQRTLETAYAKQGWDLTSSVLLLGAPTAS